MTSPQKQLSAPTSRIHMDIVIHNPIPLNYTINMLCERFCTIEPHGELHTTKNRVAPVLPCLQSGRNPRMNCLAAANMGKSDLLNQAAAASVVLYLWMTILYMCRVGITSESKLDAPTEFERWATMIQNGEGRTIKLVMINNAKELVTGRMRGFCEQQGIQIISLVLFSPSSNGVANQFHWCGYQQYSHCAVQFEPSVTLLGWSSVNVHEPVEQDTKQRQKKG